MLDFVKGDTVWELGCGNLALAREMAVTARWVHAADKNRISCRDKPDNVTFYRQHYHELQWPEWLDCVVTCWPMTCSAPGFMEILKRAFRVVYIGCNTGGVACGTHEMWLHLTKRMLVHEVRDKHNCLHCYSLVSHADPQFRSEEEIAGLLNKHGRFHYFNYDQLLVKELKWERPKHIKIL